MNLSSPRIAILFLSFLMLSASAACSSETATEDANIEEPNDDEPNDEEPTDDGLVLQGNLAPSGGPSMSSSYTLSGELAPNRPEITSSSSSFVLQQSAPISMESDGEPEQDN